MAGVTDRFPALAHDLRLVPALNREGSVRGPNAGSGPSPTPPPRVLSRVTTGDRRHAECQVYRVRGPHGYDGAKKLVERKHVALVDVERHNLVLVIVLLNVLNRDTLPALDRTES